MGFVMVLHVLLFGIACSVVSYAVARRNAERLWLLVSCVAGVVTGLILSFVFSFFVYPSLGLVPDGEDFIFATYTLFRNGALLSFMFSGLGAVFGRKRVT
jgi:hypothetical protein